MMRFELMGHESLSTQIPLLQAAMPDDWAWTVGRVRALLEAFNEDPNELDPVPVSQESWTTAALDTAGNTDPSWPPGRLTIYVYERWGVRFAFARAEFPGVIAAAWLRIEPLEKARSGMKSQLLCKALLNEAKEILWPV